MAGAKNLIGFKGIAGAGLVLIASNLAEAFCPLARAIGLAHLISPVDFGIAIAISSTVGLAELISDFGLWQSALRMAEEKCANEALGTIHTLALLRGAILGLLTAASGLVIPSLLQSSEAALAFMLLGISPLVLGFSNLGIVTATRRYSFAPSANTVLVSQVTWTGVTIWLAIVLQNYWCMLIGIYACSFSYVIASHLLSPVKWRLCWSKATAREALRYGVLLVPNGAALAASSLGDRFVVGSLLGPASLALYNTVAAGAAIPRSIIVKLVGAVALPVFVNQSARGSMQSSTFDRWTILLCGAAFFYSLCFLSFGQLALGIVFGKTYEPEQLLVSAVAISAYLKVILALPVPPAIATADSRFILFNSILNFASLASGACALLASRSLVVFVIGIVLGECAVAVIIISKAIRKYPFTRSLTWLLSMGPFAILTIGAIALAQIENIGLRGRAALFGVLGIAFAGLVLSLSWRTVQETIEALGARSTPS